MRYHLLRNRVGQVHYIIDDHKPLMYYRIDRDQWREGSQTDSEYLRTDFFTVVASHDEWQRLLLIKEYL